MAKQNFNLQEFISLSKSIGFARTNRFEVLINPPPILNQREESRIVSIFAEVSNLPPLNLTVRPFKIFGPLHQRPISSEYGGDGLAMTFHLDSGMTVKRFFDDWMESIVSRGTVGYPQFSVRYQADYITTITLRQLSQSGKTLGAGGVNDLSTNTPVTNTGEDDDVSYEVELLEAFPRSMNLVEFNNAAQNQTQRLTVIFAYRYWRRTDIKRQPTPRVRVSPVNQPVQPLPINQVNVIKNPSVQPRFFGVSNDPILEGSYNDSTSAGGAGG